MEALLIFSFFLLSSIPQISLAGDDPYYQLIQLAFQVPKSSDPSVSEPRFTLVGFRPVNTSLIHSADPLGFNSYRLIEYCPQPSSEPFHSNHVLPETLQSELSIAWKSLGPGAMSNEAFWEDEYNKHGLCTINEYPSPNYYFQKAIKVWNMYPVEEWLMKHGMYPYRAYTVRDFLNVVFQELGADPWLKCYKGGDYLMEVGLCFFKSSSVNADPVPTRCPTMAQEPYERCNRWIQYELQMIS